MHSSITLLLHLVNLFERSSLEVTEAQARWLIEDGVISGGMIPKVQACLDALASVPSVHILDGREPHVLRQALASQQGAGTMIVR